MAVLPGLSRNLSETPKIGFLVTRRILMNAVVVRVLDLGAEDRRFESYSGKGWKAFTVHPAVNGYMYLTIVGEG